MEFSGYTHPLFLYLQTIKKFHKGYIQTALNLMPLILFYLPT